MNKPETKLKILNNIVKILKDENMLSHLKDGNGTEKYYGFHFKVKKTNQKFWIGMYDSPNSKTVTIYQKIPIENWIQHSQFYIDGLTQKEIKSLIVNSIRE